MRVPVRASAQRAWCGFASLVLITTLAAGPIDAGRAASDDPASRHVYFTGGVHNDKDCIPASKCIYQRKPDEPTDPL